MQPASHSKELCQRRADWFAVAGASVCRICAHVDFICNSNFVNVAAQQPAGFRPVFAKSDSSIGVAFRDAADRPQHGQLQAVHRHSPPEQQLQPAGQMQGQSSPQNGQPAQEELVTCVWVSVADDMTIPTAERAVIEVNIRSLENIDLLLLPVFPGKHGVWFEVLGRRDMACPRGTVKKISTRKARNHSCQEQKSMRGGGVDGTKPVLVPNTGAKKS
jgi:hypothetical protein